MKKILLTLLSQCGVGINALVEPNNPESFVARARWGFFDKIGYSIELHSSEENELTYKVSKDDNVLLVHCTTENNHISSIDIEEI